MHINFLISAISEHLEDLLKDLILQPNFEDEGKRSPLVFRYDMPAKRRDSAADHPFLLVVPTGAEVESEITETVSVAILVETFDDDPNHHGLADTINIAERVKNDFLMNPVLQNTFQCNNSISLNFDPASQSPPYYVAEILTEWTVTKSINSQISGYL